MLTVLCLVSRALSSSTVTMLTKGIRGPRPVVICGPSGSGKSTLLKKLFAEFPNTFGFSTSHTTRQPREGEKDGVHYYFVSREEMERAIANGEFIETAVFCENYYGTSKMAVQKVQESGRVCILDIEPQGVEQLRRTDLNAILIFNNPPSMEELERRIRKRKTETEETLKKRLEAAKKEIEYGLRPGNFHKVINNDDIETAYRELREFIVAMLKEQEAQGIPICWH